MADRIDRASKEKEMISSKFFVFPAVAGAFAVGVVLGGGAPAIDTALSFVVAEAQACPGGGGGNRGGNNGFGNGGGDGVPGRSGKQDRTR